MKEKKLPTAQLGQSSKRRRKNTPQGFSIVRLWPRTQTTVLFLGVACILIVVVLASLNVKENQSIAFALGTFVLHTTTLLILWNQHAKRYGILSPIAYLVAVKMASTVLRDTPFVIYGLDYHDVIQGSPESITSLFAFQMFLSWCAFLSLGVTFHLFKSPHVVRFSNYRDRSLKVIIAFGLLFSISGLALIIATSGGVNAHFNNILIGRSARIYTGDAENLGVFFVMTKMGAIVTLYWVACREGVFRQLFFWMMVAIVIVSAYVESGSRSAPLNYILMLLIVRAIRTGKMPILRISILVIAGIIFIGATQLLREVRVHGDIQSAGDREIVSSAIIGVGELRERRGSSSGSLAVIARGPSEQGYLWGETYLVSLLRFVPRAVWPGKPIGIDSQVGINFWGYQVGKPPGGVAEAYWNLGIFGVFIVYCLYGAFLKWIFELTVANRHRPDIIVMYVVTICVFSPAQTAISHWYFLIIPTLMICLIAGLSISRPISRRAPG